MPEQSSMPDFKGLARTTIEMFHPEVLNFPEDIIELAVEKKAQELRESYQAMLHRRR